MTPAAPRIIFNNTFKGTGNETLDLPTRPQDLGLESLVERRTNRTEGGQTQTLFRHERDVIEMKFDFIRDDRLTLKASHMQKLMELWKSTRARETFTLYVHRDYAGNYPTSEAIVIRQPLTVQWAEGFDSLKRVRTDRVRNLWGLALRFEEAVI